MRGKSFPLFVLFLITLILFTGDVSAISSDNQGRTENPSSQNGIISENEYFRLESVTLKWPSGYNGTNIWWGDFNTDGFVDFIISINVPKHSMKGNPLAAWQNNGDGTFKEVTKKIFGSKGVIFKTGNFALFDDYNNDGRNDLFFEVDQYYKKAVYGGQNRLFFMTKKGRYKEVTNSHLPERKDFPHWTESGDIDRDGDIDIWLPCAQLEYTEPWEGEDGSNYHKNAHCKLLRNEGNGNFIDDIVNIPERIANFSYQFGFCKLVDINRDGAPELYTTGLEDMRPGIDIHIRYNETILMNDGNGVFSYTDDDTLPKRYREKHWHKIWYGSYGLNYADINGDGWFDLISTPHDASGKREDGQIQIMINNKKGKFTDETKRVPNYDKMVDFVEVADLNGDGFVDLIAGGDNKKNRILLNDGKGYYKDFTKMVGGFDQDYWESSLTGWLKPFDVDGDGDTDLVTRGFRDGKWHIYLLRNLSPIKSTVKKHKLPGKPKLKGPSSKSEVSTGPTLVWKHKKRATWYRIQIAEKDDFAQTVLDMKDYTGNELDLSRLKFKAGFDGLKSGKKYYWRVAGYHYGGQGKWSSTREFQTQK